MHQLIQNINSYLLLLGCQLRIETDRDFLGVYLKLMWIHGVFSLQKCFSVFEVASNFSKNGRDHMYCMDTKLHRVIMLILVRYFCCCGFSNQPIHYTKFQNYDFLCSLMLFGIMCELQRLLSQWAMSTYVKLLSQPRCRKKCMEIKWMSPLPHNILLFSHSRCVV